MVLSLAPADGAARDGLELLRTWDGRLDSESPAACVFVDDWDKNVEAARAVGMQAIFHRFDQGDDLRAQLAAVGVTAGT